MPDRFVHLVEITRDCDLRCPVCYAGCGPGGGGGLDLATIRERGRQVRADGGRIITLTGGEPTTHAQLLPAVRALRRLGLGVALVSNGVRLAREPALARALAQAGLGKVLLQCDSLEPEHRRLLRGDDDTGVPVRAAAAVRAAGLRLGIIATVCRPTLPALGALLDWALASGCGSVQLQGFGRTGRFPADLAGVQRDEIAAALALGTRRADLEVADLHAPPVHAPWHAATHPDCALVVLLLRRGGRWIPLGRTVDVPTMLTRWAARPAGGGLWRVAVRPLADAWRSVRPGHRLAALGHAWSALRGGACLITLGTYPDGPAPERHARCGTCFVTADGPVPACVHARNAA